jgi:serine/threonine-protein kinase
MSIDTLRASLADRYVIDRELGQGGMATVYLAHDVKHDRDVAIKVLREDLSASLGAGRFLREIKIAAQLQHPNILPLLDSGSAQLNPERSEGPVVLYFVMPYIKGQSLRERLAREGELPVHEAIRLISEVVDALVEAHSHGVVHRDIKPDNVMLSGRHALVTDFGVAKAISEATGRNTVTTLGVAVGTPTYMSPEQAAADPHVDHRSDIYSVGVMAYEMLAGRPPFTGSTPQQVLAAHVTEAPDPVAKRRAAIPPAVEAVVMRCLAKRPADRFQTASELLAALEPFTTPSIGVTPTHTAPTRAVRRPLPLRSAIAALVVIALVAVAWWQFGPRHNRGGTTRAIAVLPFTNVSHDTADDYLADGIANDVRDGLMELPGLTVKARTSSEAAKGKPVHEAGALLNADVLLQGEYRRTAAHVTVTVDLVKVNDESALWSHDYTLPPDGNFAAAQDSIATAVSQALHLAVSKGSPDAASQRGTTDIAAYDLYLKGQYFFARRNSANLAHAIEYYQQAIAKDSNFARAWADLAVTESVFPSYVETNSDSALRMAEQHARRALAIDPSLADAHLALANALTSSLQPAAAEPEYLAAEAADPRNATVHQWHGDNLNVLGRSDDAMREGKAALALDPLSAVAWNDYAYILESAGKYADALAATHRELELDPSLEYGYQYAGIAYLFSGNVDSARGNLDKSFLIDSTAPGMRSNRIWALVLAGQWAAAAAQRAIIARSEHGTRDFDLAVADIALGDTASALDNMERALRDRSYYLAVSSLGCDPTFSMLWNQPRFVAVAKAVGQPICNRPTRWPMPAPPGHKE